MVQLFIIIFPETICFDAIACSAVCHRVATPRASLDKHKTRQPSFSGVRCAVRRRRKSISSSSSAGSQLQFCATRSAVNASLEKSHATQNNRNSITTTLPPAANICHCMELHDRTSHGGL